MMNYREMYILSNLCGMKVLQTHKYVCIDYIVLNIAGLRSSRPGETQVATYPASLIV